MAKQNKVSAFQKHKMSDKIKWFVVFTLVLLLIASVVAICVTLVPGFEGDNVSAVSDVAPVSVQNIDEEDAIKISFEYDPENAPTVEEVFGADIFESTLIRPYVIDTGMMGEIGGATLVIDKSSYEDFLYCNYIVKSQGTVEDGYKESYSLNLGLFWGESLDSYIGFLKTADTLEDLESAKWQFAGFSLNGEDVVEAMTVDIQISGLVEVANIENYIFE